MGGPYSPCHPCPLSGENSGTGGGPSLPKSEGMEGEVPVDPPRLKSSLIICCLRRLASSMASWRRNSLREACEWVELPPSIPWGPGYPSVERLEFLFNRFFSFSFF